MRCPYCGKIITEKEKKKHKCFIEEEAERDIKPIKWKPGARE